MLETVDWKREKIGDYRALSAIVAGHKDSIAKDARIKELVAKEMEIEAQVKALRKDRLNTIAEAQEEQQMIKTELQDHWDIDGKSFKCDMGSATMRTTKTLKISDQSALLICLFNLERLESAIRTLDTAYLRKLKDADMIPDAMAVYESKTMVAITEAPQ